MKGELPRKRRTAVRMFDSQPDLRVTALMGGEQQLSYKAPPSPRYPVDPGLIGGPYKAPPSPRYPVDPGLIGGPYKAPPSPRYPVDPGLIGGPYKAPPSPQESPGTTDPIIYFEGPYKPPPAPGYVNISTTGMQKWVSPEEGKVWMDQMEARRRSEWESASSPTGQLYLNRMAENERARELGIAPRNDENGRPFYVPYDFGSLIAR